MDNTTVHVKLPSSATNTSRDDEAPFPTQNQSPPSQLPLARESLRPITLRVFPCTITYILIFTCTI